MSYDGNENRTEHATEHRVKKALEKGNNSYSYELNSMLILSFYFFVLWFFRTEIINNLLNIVNKYLIFDHNIIYYEIDIFSSSIFLYKKIIKIILPLFLCVFFISYISPIIFSNSIIKFRSIKFKLNILNIFLGFKNIFSINTFIELLKIVLKVFFIIFFIMLYLFLNNINSQSFLCLSTYNPINAFIFSFTLIERCVILCMLSFLPVVILDFFWKKFLFFEKIKMSKEEVKEEYKEINGNPEIKARIRRAMKIAIRNKVASNVAKSDVIITNPLHYAIAIQYDEMTMEAPIVLSKGKGKLAFKIKNIAKKNKIPIFECAKLARSLYTSSEVGDCIPWMLYKILAEILAWVWKLKKWKKEGGVYPEKPVSSFII
ncbi:EscU/YscU/HrcU family type III secretion system export apparatus switch protein [Buchnera aphidicola]|uniref:EscU/YscU/HrcU family type III secretion system export apparatus switch protein n=1 Tax=Buchnera aphidicola TaxID=9 RepID=UPI00165169BD|nr:EscU/YscU/HrcU family type III secretion system export apparatus switch protein [Buchnera aphidicola]